MEIKIRPEKRGHRKEQFTTSALGLAGFWCGVTVWVVNVAFEVFQITFIQYDVSDIRNIAAPILLAGWLGGLSFSRAALQQENTARKLPRIGFVLSIGYTAVVLGALTVGAVTRLSGR